MRSLLPSLEATIANNRWFIFSFVALFALLGVGLNFYYTKAPIMGMIFFLMYFVPNTVFAGRILFRKESLGFKLLYGSLLLLVLVAIAGTLAYLIHDFSNPAMIITLALLTIALSVINKKRSSNVSINVSIKERGQRTSKAYLPVILFFLSIALCVYFLASARTGESLRTVWHVVPLPFFVFFFLAIFLLLFMILRQKRGRGIILLYITLLTSIPALVYLLALKYPAEPAASSYIAWNRHFTDFGRFVSDPSHEERVTSWFNKSIETTGLSVLVATFSRFLQVDPLWIQRIIIPSIFSIYVPISAYKLVSFIAPGKRELACIASIAFLFSQHCIFSLVPPSMPETLALALLLVSILFWIRYIEEGKLLSASFLPPLLLTIAIGLIHSYIAQYALALAVVSIFLNKTRLFDYRHRHWVRNRKGVSIFIVLILLLMFSLIPTYLIGNKFGITNAHMNPDFNFVLWLKLIFPTSGPIPASPLAEQAFFGYLNYFVIPLYILILLGLVVSFRERLNLNWIVVTLALIALSLANMTIQKFFYPTMGWQGEWYRFFHYLNFVSFILVGIGIYQLKEYIAGIKFTRIRQVVFPVFILLFCGAMTASLYGGFPRVGSMGPYTATALSYPSDYDFEALKFIEENSGDKDFFIVSDHYTATAGLQELGHKVIIADTVYQIYITSYWFGTFKQLWPQLTNQVNSYVLEEAVKLTNIADETYLILSYRLGQPRLEQLVDTYTFYLGEPVFEHEGKIYVFDWESGAHYWWM